MTDQLWCWETFLIVESSSFCSCNILMLNMTLFPQRPTTHTTPTTETPSRPISGYHVSYDSWFRFPTMPRKRKKIYQFYPYIIMWFTKILWYFPPIHWQFPPYNSIHICHYMSHTGLSGTGIPPMKSRMLISFPHQLLDEDMPHFGGKTYIPYIPFYPYISQTVYYIHIPYKYIYISYIYIYNIYIYICMYTSYV